MCRGLTTEHTEITERMKASSVKQTRNGGLYVPAGRDAADRLD